MNQLDQLDSQSGDGFGSVQSCQSGAYHAVLIVTRNEMAEYADGYQNEGW